MLLVTKIDADRFDARFICPAMFIPCVGARDDETAQKLAAAFKHGDLQSVKSLKLNSQPNDSCW
jgi:protein-L-isoaspartate(D-aspartate) O-methyltransferase